ncbi:hypothetical protein P7C70_g9652, partial [Phenoliferia sp. Uapishka_3]
MAMTARALVRTSTKSLQLASRRHLATVSNGAVPVVEEHDILIVGGGPVGLALAAALGNLNLSLLLYSQLS